MEGIRGFQHPLETPIILECIFKHLDITDLKSCRLVCRTWRRETAKAMRSSVKVRICLGKSDPDLEEAAFLELIQTETSTFFQAPFVDTFILFSRTGKSSEFWRICGAYVKSLGLQYVTFDTVDAFRHAIFQSCPNLKELNILNVKVHGRLKPEPKEWMPPQYSQNTNLKTLTLEGIDKEFTMGRLEILSHFPCFENLFLINIGDHFEDIFNAVEILRKHNATCWKLKELKFNRYPSRIAVPLSLVRVCGEGNLALTKLEINGIVGSTMEDVSAIRKVLAANADSLKKLALIEYSDDHPEIDIFPLPGDRVLKNVQSFTMIGLVCNSMKFQQVIPNVKKLSLDVKKILGDIPMPLNHCTELLLYSEIKETGDLRRLFCLLPNLKRLKMYGLNNEWFSLVCEHWSGLTHLEFCSFGIDDAGISGYDPEDVEEINRLKGKWKPTTVRKANLSSLKYLQSFSLTLYREYPTLGYCSEEHGILELPQLQHLRVYSWDLVEEVPLFKSLESRFPWGRAQARMFDVE